MGTCRRELAGREIVPELIQDQADAEHIAATVRAILETPGKRAAMVTDLHAVRAQLGRGGACAGRSACGTPQQGQ